MPTRIRILERIIVNVRIPIPGLGALALLRDDGIRLGEASQGGVVPAGVVKHQAKAFADVVRGWVVHVGVLAGEGIVRGQAGIGARREADFAPGRVAQFGGLRPGCIGGDAGRTEVVREQEG